MSAIELLFLGTGTSAGIPMIGCKCPVCTSDDPRDRRTRPSVVISYDNQRYLVDTTPELRLQCVANNVDWIDGVVMTHAHADHIMGLDDIRRFNAIRNGPLDVWADKVTHDVLTQCFGYAFRAPDPTVQVFRPHLERKFITGPFDLGGRTWTPIPLLHGGMKVLGFRVGNLAYCTDVSEIPAASYELLRDLDVLVLDALTWHKHPTHFSIAESLEEIKKIRPRRTYFTHIAHGVRHAECSNKLPENVWFGQDGLVVEST